MTEPFTNRSFVEHYLAGNRHGRVFTWLLRFAAACTGG